MHHIGFLLLAVIEKSPINILYGMLMLSIIETTNQYLFSIKHKLRKNREQITLQSSFFIQYLFYFLGYLTENIGLGELTGRR